MNMGLLLFGMKFIAHTETFPYSSLTEVASAANLWIHDIADTNIIANHNLIMTWDPLTIVTLICHEY